MSPAALFRCLAIQNFRVITKINHFIDRTDKIRIQSIITVARTPSTLYLNTTMTIKKTEITLKGSIAIVSDFFFTAINSILYQRGMSEPMVQLHFFCHTR
jgi:hypothetical protein